jgi:hypothetical protein
MPDFPHLPLPQKASGVYNAPRGGGKKKISEITSANKSNRVQHGLGLKANAEFVLNSWYSKQDERLKNNLPKLPDSKTIPVFLQVDTDLFKIDSLASFGIEIIAEEEDGYIIGASGDNFKSFKEKIDSFIKNHGQSKDQAAQLWNLIVGDKWRLDYIVSEELNQKWEQISDKNTLLVDISIACYLKPPTEPKKSKNERERRFLRRYKEWQDSIDRHEKAMGHLELERQEEFQNFLESLGGELVSSFVSFNDSFCCRLKINGNALKDLVINYQYIFDVTEYDDLVYHDLVSGQDIDMEVEILSPDDNDPAVCIIDSGIQEQHKLLADAIDTTQSRTYIPGSTDTSDMVPNGGHGTKVAGAVVYGRVIPKNGQYKSNTWIYNAKILDNNGLIPAELFPPELMENICDDYPDTKLFNLSVNAFRPCKKIHMSEWAAAIDNLMYKNDVLFIISAGNIETSSVLQNNPGIRQHLLAGRNYPGYLLEGSSRIANPGQSCFALTVGSVCLSEFEDLDKISFGKIDQPSSFSRCGPGLWGMIKPDVVEYGGDYIKEKNANPNISTLLQVSSEVVRTTYNGGNAVGHHVGTSYAAPKVSHIAATIYKEVKGASNLMVKALIAQSARLPAAVFHNPTDEHLRTFGYGIPDIDRATQNTAHRITLVDDGTISAKSAQIYTIAIPEAIRRAGNEYDVLVEVSLSFLAKPRRTRRGTHSYLSTWLDWKSSKLGESYNRFEKRMIKYISTDQADEGGNDEVGTIQWKIRERSHWGIIQNFKRQDSSLQKDWTVFKAYNLPEEFSIAVIGHQGWEKDVNVKVPYSIAVSFEVTDLEIDVDIYNLIRIENEIEIEQEVRV